MSRSAWLRRSSFSSVLSSVLCLPLPAPPLAQKPDDAGCVLLQRRAAYDGLSGFEVLCGVGDDALQVSERFPAVGAGRVPGGFEDLEREVRLHTAISQHEPGEGHRIVVAAALWRDVAGYERGGCQLSAALPQLGGRDLRHL